MPKLSVILPVYNGAEHIKEAVQSIIDQNYTDYDLFILDDGSSDGTLNILQQFEAPNVKIVLNEGNKGLIYTLNKGLSLSADYEYVARMDADDISLPNRLSATVAILDQNKNVGVAGTSVDYFGLGLKTQTVTLPQKNDSILPAFICRNPIIHPSVTIRNKVLQQYGIQYDADYYKYEDYKLWLDLFKKCEFYNTPEVHFLYRRHANNVSNVSNYQLDDDLQMINKILLKYAESLDFEFTAQELYSLSIITSTHRWQINKALNLNDLHYHILSIIGKHDAKLINKKYLASLLWERAFIYLLKTKRYADFTKLLYKLNTTIDYSRILKIYKNWY